MHKRFILLATGLLRLKEIAKDLQRQLQRKEAETQRLTDAWSIHKGCVTHCLKPGMAMDMKLLQNFVI